MCECLEKRYLQLRSGVSLNQEYLSKLYRFEQWASYKADGLVFQGKITGVALSGKLEIETDTEIKYFDIKEIAFI
jgi:BirA family transcriptional regulator, biotin operon repressor / biotin---[acetyl-CoA-carboxylase] ligase